MNKTALLLSLLLFFCAGTSAVCQERSDASEIYLESVKDKAVLYNGPTAFVYPFLYDGTYYVFGERFESNDLYYNGKLYRGVDLNLNAHRGELLIRMYGSVTTVVLNRSLVEWFTLGGRRFVSIGDEEYEGLPGGYYEALYEGSGLVLKRTEKVYGETIRNGRTEYSFSPRVSRHVVSDGRAYTVKHVDALAKIHRPLRHEIRDYIGSRGGGFTDRSRLDASLVSVMEYIDGLKSQPAK